MVSNAKRRWFGTPLITASLTGLTLLGVLGMSGCAAARPDAAPAATRWLITGTHLYVSPDQAPLADAWLLVKGSKIEAVGTGTPPAHGASSPAACNGGVIVAGFQNSHVHFTDPSFADAQARPAAQLTAALTLMLSRYGYTTVVDTGSELSNTAALRRRVGSGAVAGPDILTTGLPLYPSKGIPIYLEHLPAALLRSLPQPATPAEAVDTVRRQTADGADATKLFVVSPVGQGQVRRMDPDVARAAADETHRLGGLVMVHPTDPDGIRSAVSAGADVIVHTTIDPPDAAWTSELIAAMVARKVALVPTLKLWRHELDKDKVPADVRERIVAAAERQLKAFADAGGQVLFGTDVGYMPDADPTEEYELMARAGMTPMQILASLTTAPAQRWGRAAERGRLQAGMAANIVVLAGDPARDVKRYADVTCTAVGGRLIFQRD